MKKEEKLQEVAAEIESCTLCKQGTTGMSVPGEGSASANIVFVGEAPGKQEAAIGRPFVGRSGQLLRRLIKGIGCQENSVFITSIGKYLPIRKTPSASQIVHGRVHLKKQIAIIQPKIVVLLGNTAIQGVLQEKLPIKKVHGTIREEYGYIYFLTLHPAAALRFPPLRKELENDFYTLQRLIHDKL